VRRLEALSSDLGVVVGKVLRQTDKSILLEGTSGDTPVVVKLLIDPDPFWQAKLGREISAYRMFADHPPPIRVPRLIHTDGERFLVLERLVGRPLDPDRYPTRPLPNAEVDATLEAVNALRAWRPPLTPAFDYARRIDRYHSDGLFTDADADVLRHLFDTWSGEWEVNHGDPLPSNVFLTTDDHVALLDWEFTGYCLPGFDLALLYALLSGTEHAVRRIDRAVADGGIGLPFTINLAMVLTRELRIHREVQDDARLALIEPLWAEARARLQPSAGLSG
jgi:hypothetical protein